MEAGLPALLLLALLGSASATLDDFYFSRHPQNHVVREGGAVHLGCMVSNTSFIRFYWQLDGRTVLNSSRRFQRGSDLHITRVDRSQDSGHFTCIAMNVTTGFSLTSLAAELNIIWMDRTARVQLQSPSSPAAIRPGSDVTLRCRADGSGDVTYQWLHNGRPVANHRRAARHKRLQLNNVQPRHAGVYSCRATNDAGIAHSDVTFPLIVPSRHASLVTLVPEDQLVRRGTTATFHCQYRDAETTEWFFGDTGPLTTEGKRTVLSNHSLLVSDVEEQDVGWYHCRGIQSGVDSVPQTYSAQLILAYLKPLTERSVEPAPAVPSLYVVPEGRQLQLTCRAPEGRPTPSVWWEDPQGRVINSPQQSAPDDAAVLILDSARLDQSGNYSCVAENLSGTSSVQVRLLVAAPPELISGPSDLTVVEGQRAEMRCLFRGLQEPLSTVSWVKDGRRLKSGTKDVNRANLVIPAVKLSDGGRYQCVINSTGLPLYRSKSATLIVKEKLKFSPRPVSQALELGKPARLPCAASGSSPPTVGWVRLRASGRPEFQWPDHVTDDHGTLVFSTVKESDGGRYSCVATNSQGLINATINITVVVTPKFLSTPRNPTEAVVGRPLLLDCQAHGRPEPNVQWDRNSKLAGITEDPRFVVLQNGSLYIKELQYRDQALYGCIAGNSGGFSRQEVQLLVRSSESELTDVRSLTPGMAADEGVMSRTVIITVSAAAAYLVLVAGLMAWCRYRRTKRKQQYARTPAEGTSVLLGKTYPEEATGSRGRYLAYPASDTFRTGSPTCRYSSSAGYRSPSVQDGCHSYQSIRSEPDSQPSLRSETGGDGPRIERHQLQRLMPLGRGEFGEVFLARVRHRRQHSDPDPVVMVKSLLNREEPASSEFLREAELYDSVSPHPAVVRLLGVFREEQPHLMVFEYTDWGDLKQFLLATRSACGGRDASRPPPLSADQALSLCRQLAAGLAHIHSCGFLHRDVAARNCVVSSRLGAKLGCGRLSEEPYSGEYWRGRPLRWLAPEALAGQLSARSDCWAWAVLCWEVLAGGLLPHAAVSDQRLARDGPPPLAVPPETPAPLAAAMTRCWQASPWDRPDMDTVLAMLDGPADGKK